MCVCIRCASVWMAVAFMLEVYLHCSGQVLPVISQALIATHRVDGALVHYPQWRVYELYESTHRGSKCMELVAAPACCMGVSRLLLCWIVRGFFVCGCAVALPGACQCTTRMKESASQSVEMRAHTGAGNGLLFVVAIYL